MAYGADISTRQFVCLCIALCLGTFVEWMDFTVYSQLSSTLTTLFFPSSNPVTAELSYWAIYAVGFLSRPLGAVVFGHVGDYYGRRVTMVASLILITIPTVLIGCLPTYSHVGIAAPITLAILRFAQGVALGGEYGSAIIYLYEVAPVGRKGIVASLAQQAVAPGIIFGTLACLIVMYACTPDQLLLWGWRLPFLGTALAAPLAIALRMHMPEPYEYLQSKHEMVLHRVASIAAARAAHSFSNHREPQEGSELGRSLSSKQVSLRLQSMTNVVVTPGTASTASDADEHAASLHTQQQSVDNSHAAVGGAAAGRAEHGQDVQQQRQDVVGGVGSHSNDGNSAAGSPRVPRTHSSPAAAGTTAANLQSLLGQHKLVLQHPKTMEAPGCEEEYAAELEGQGGKVKHHVPLLVLMKEHWHGVWLHCFVKASQDATFYTFFSWFPSYLHTSANVPMQTSLWAVMIGMVFFAVTSTCMGWLCDKGIPKVYTLIGIVLVLAAASIPVTFAMHTGSVVCLLVLLPIMLGMCGCIGGLMPSIGPLIYPAGVRVTGYNLGHNMATTLWGGLVPLQISSLSLVMQPSALAAGVLLSILGVVSLSAGLLLSKVAPQTNVRGPNKDWKAAVHRQALPAASANLVTVVGDKHEGP